VELAGVDGADVCAGCCVDASVGAFIWARAVIEMNKNRSARNMFMLLKCK
jgi:hypothetical protein